MEWLRSNCWFYETFDAFYRLSLGLVRDWILSVLTIQKISILTVYNE